MSMNKNQVRSYYKSQVTRLIKVMNIAKLIPISLVPDIHPMYCVVRNYDMFRAYLLIY